MVFLLQISENAERLQMGEISMMVSYVAPSLFKAWSDACLCSQPEGLVKISTQLYETIMPMVKAQVESQVR